MSNFCIYLKVEPYLKHFLENAFGDPVQVMRDSPESRIIRQFISKTPDGELPDLGDGSNLRVEIPYFKEADPRVYNFMGERAKIALIDSFDHILKACMMKELGALENYRRGEISKQIYAWMEKHGIPEENWYTISQKFYRLRKKYLEKEVKL
ncbi:MAG: hypothetical protein PHG64_12415 [Paludibacter sp.]|nr:hypothetical protein [Paludibacter sp.]